MHNDMHIYPANTNSEHTSFTSIGLSCNDAIKYKPHRANLSNALHFIRRNDIHHAHLYAPANLGSTLLLSCHASETYTIELMLSLAVLYYNGHRDNHGDISGKHGDNLLHAFEYNYPGNIHAFEYNYPENIGDTSTYIRQADQYFHRS